MKKSENKLEKVNIIKTGLGFKAVCSKGDFNGQVRQSETKASQDAVEHQAGRPDHHVEIIAV